MKLALVGYGKMGRALDELATTKGFEIVERFHRERPLRARRATREALAGAVLVDFSAPEAVYDTVRSAADLSLNLVIGTTGWRHRIDEIRAVADASGIGIVHASNFSVAVHVVYSLVEHAARLMSTLEGYDAFIFDWHHRFKADSPSGTALEIQRRMARYYRERHVPVTSQRAGYVPSVHAVGFDSEADTVYIEHRARNRRALAGGALLAAEWVAGRSGLHEFDEVLAATFRQEDAAATTPRSGTDRPPGVDGRRC